MDSTFIPDQNSTAVSIRGGFGASASAASILSGQLSTDAVSAVYILSGQVSTACILAAVSTPIPEQNFTTV